MNYLLSEFINFRGLQMYSLAFEDKHGGLD